MHTHTHTPNAFRNDDVLLGVSIDALHEREVRVEALDGEEPVHEGVEQSLVKVVVYPSSVDALGEKGPQGTPGHLVWRQVGATLQEGEGTTLQSSLKSTIVNMNIRTYIIWNPEYHRLSTLYPHTYIFR